MGSKRLSPAGIVALREALCTIYWYKADLRSFLEQCPGDKAVIGQLNWNNYKRQIVADLLEELTADQNRFLGALTRLCRAVTDITNFSHLEQLEGGDQKLAELNKRFMGIAQGVSLQQRGYDLERLMYDLFKLFDLDPKASFHVVGEQLDGAFSLEGTDYLFEARWRAESARAGDLDAFAGKVERKLENTLGVFLSMNGFSPDGVEAHSSRRPSIILMDGADLMAVLEERIDFVALLMRKKRHAAQTGNIYLRIHEIGA